MATATLGWATTIRPPDFSALVGRADQVVAATVVGSESREVQRGDSVIIETYVTFAVDDLISGAALDGNAPLILRHLGGRVGDTVMEVDGMPRFAKGERLVLFVEGGGRTVCPLVGWGHGKYEVFAGADGVQRIRRADGTPLRALEQVDDPLRKHGAGPTVTTIGGDGAMTMATFKNAITAERERLKRVQ